MRFKEGWKKKKYMSGNKNLEKLTSDSNNNNKVLPKKQRISYETFSMAV